MLLAMKTSQLNLRVAETLKQQLKIIAAVTNVPMKDLGSVAVEDLVFDHAEAIGLVPLRLVISPENVDTLDQIVDANDLQTRSEAIAKILEQYSC